MIYGSICSGIEAASVAWHPLGWRAAFLSEIEAFPRAVLAHHYPTTPLHGDFTSIREGDYAAIDVLVGGTPCQSFSVAGLRAGLDDERGNLALEFCRLARRLRPRWVVWENVPGVLSLDGGRPFASILGGLAECGYGLAYRVLDAQFVRVDGFARAVPQRRRRVFVVGHLGDWRRAAAVLFERESLSGDPPPRREAGQGAAPTLAARTRGGGGLGTDFDCDGGLIPGVSKSLSASRGQACANADDLETYLPVARCVTAGHGKRIDFETETFVALRGRDEGATAELTGDVMTALRCGGGGGDKPHVLAPICFTSKDHGADAQEGIAPTLRSMNFDKSHANAGGQLAICFDETQITSAANRCQPQEGDPSHPLAAGARAPTIAFRTTGNDGCYDNGDVAPCLGTATDPNHTTLLTNWRVRRLTPVECERLQGFPDGWTDVPYRGKHAADGPRYKALGNAMAVNVMRWLGQRIAMADGLTNVSLDAAGKSP